MAGNHSARSTAQTAPDTEDFQKFSQYRELCGACEGCDDLGDRLFTLCNEGTAVYEQYQAIGHDFFSTAASVTTTKALSALNPHKQTLMAELLSEKSMQQELAQGSHLLLPLFATYKALVDDIEAALTLCRLFIADQNPTTPHRCVLTAGSTMLVQKIDEATTVFAGITTSIPSLDAAVDHVKVAAASRRSSSRVQDGDRAAWRARVAQVPNVAATHPTYSVSGPASGDARDADDDEEMAEMGANAGAGGVVDE